MGRAAGVGWQVLRVFGPAAERFLQRMLSNTVADLPPDRTRGAFLLAASGRIVSGGLWLRHGDGLAALCATGWAEPLRDGLLRYRVADRVEFAIDARPAWLWLDPPAPLLPEQGAVIRSAETVYLRMAWTGAREVVVWGDGPPELAEVAASAVEAARIAHGTPRFGAELTTDVIPLEAGMRDWLSHTKGCYVGQEVIERMWSRKRVARRLVRLRGERMPAAALPLPLQGDGAKGTLTSVAADTARGTVALGYLSGTAPVLYTAGGEPWHPVPADPPGAPT